MNNPTAAQTAKLSKLLVEADLHGDRKTVALVELALAGDADALAQLGIAARATRAARTGASSRAPSTRRSPFAPRRGSAGAGGHPWSHDEE